MQLAKRNPASRAATVTGRCVVGRMQASRTPPSDMSTFVASEFDRASWSIVDTIGTSERPPIRVAH